MPGYWGFKIAGSHMGGGIESRPAALLGQNRGIGLYMCSDDIDKDLIAAEAAGAAITQSRFNIGKNHGTCAKFVDPAGNVNGLYNRGDGAITTKDLTSEVKLNVSADTVFDTFMESAQHAACTKLKAVVDKSNNGVFNIGDGMLTGRTVEACKQSGRIVQSWRATKWPAAHWSLLTLAITKTGASSCTVSLKQTGIPEEHYDKCVAGWQNAYWANLKVAK